MRRVLLVLLLCPTVASADLRLDTEPIPELFPLEAVFQLDRGMWSSDKSGAVGSIGLGYGRFDDRDTGTIVGALSAGKYTENWLVLGTAEIVSANDTIWRARHRGLVGLHSEEDRDDGIGGSIVLSTALDLGEARALAPVRYGQGRYDNGAVAGEALLHLGKDKDDVVFVAQLFGELGTTRWESPLLDRANRASLGLGVGLAPADGELPRGAIDLLRGRVEHVSIARPIVAAGAAAPIGAADVRIAELGLGAHEMTLHIDRELLAVIEGDLGWSWIEVDTASGRIADNMFRMKLATGLKWLASRSGAARRFGIGLARDPQFTPDGQRIVVDWRAVLAYGVDTRIYSVRASGGISWIRSIAGGSQPMLPRYGSSIEAFYKIGRGLEAGAYHAASFESQMAGDPAAAPRTWSVEAGVLLRWRYDPDTMSRPPRYVCGAVLDVLDVH